MITLPSLNEFPSEWNEIHEQLETDFSIDLKILLHERLTKHEAKQLEQDFIDSVGCAPEEYARTHRIIGLLEARYPDSLNELAVAAVATPLGKMLAVFGDKDLRLLKFIGQEQLGQEVIAVRKALHGQFIFQKNEQTQLLHQKLDLYFQGRLKAFVTPLEMIGTTFQQQVWNALLTIPYGETHSYRGQAQQLDNLKAIHAVAAANGQNKVSILVPCHRVIGSGGRLAGYAGGLNRKQLLLALERGEVQTALFWVLIEHKGSYFGQTSHVKRN